MINNFQHTQLKALNSKIGRNNLITVELSLKRAFLN